jgi:DNA-binding response OmpR family regulator
VLPVLRRWDLPADRARHRATRGCRTLSLTREEYGILEMLLAVMTSHRTTARTRRPASPPPPLNPVIWELG